jgi:YHS domain-containing protein
MKKVIFLLISFSFLQSCIAQKKAQSEFFSTTDGAIKGFDPVAYFTTSKPQKGKENIAYEWKNATWHFDSEDNKQLFVANPEKYAPQYGGYCAFGWAKGYAVKIEPDAWSIVNEKLYLNYDKSVQTDWDKDRQGYIKKADANFAKKKM